MDTLFSGIDPLLLESFGRDLTKTLKMLQEICDSADYENESNLKTYTLITHGIKSSLRNIGIPDLASTAASLEEAGRELNFDLIKSRTPSFIGELQALLNKMQPAQSSSSGGTDPSDLLERLYELKEKCSDYNRRGALSVIAAIESFSNKTGTVLEVIKEHISNSDYDEAEAEADKYAAEVKLNPPSQETSAASSPVSEKLIFVVSTSEETLLSTAATLEDNNNVLTMSSIDKMFSILQKKKPDIIMLDKSIPGVDSSEIFNKIKENPTCQDIELIEI